MNIPKIQLYNERKRIIQQLLKQGQPVTKNKVQDFLGDYMDAHIIGTPEYTPALQAPYETSNRESYNHNFASLKKDLTTLYDANTETGNEYISVQEEAEQVKAATIGAIHHLKTRLQNLCSLLETGFYNAQYVESFQDFCNIEMNGDKERNIPHTDCFLDLRNHCAMLPTVISQCQKLNLDEASIHFYKNGFEAYKEVNSLSNVLTDVIDEYYIFHGMNELCTKKTIGLQIDLLTPAQVNTLSFYFTSPMEQTFHLSLSEDGTNFLDVYDIKSSSDVTWNFKTRTVVSFRIDCQIDKTENIYEDEQMYHYYLMIRNISIENNRYQTSASFITGPISFDRNVSSIQFDAFDKNYHDTNIAYYIGMDNKTGRIGWDRIENHSEQKMFMFEKKHQILNSSIVGFGERTAHGLYRIFRLEEEMNPTSIRLFAGYQMWKCEQYKRTTGDQDDGFSLLESSCDLTDYIQHCQKSIRFMDCDDVQGFAITTNTLYIFSQYVYAEQDDILENKYLRVVLEGNAPISSEIRLFVNGVELNPINGQYNIALKAGRNKIQFALYCRSDSILPCYVSQNMNFKELTSNVFGCEEMESTNVLYLASKTKEEYHEYCIENGFVCVKNNPNEMIKDRIRDMGYFIVYEALKPEMTGFFDSQTPITFRIMAVLLSDSDDCTPQLESIRLLGR